MQRVDQRHEVVRRAEASRGREITDRLVAPTAVERMLRDRQELDVRVAHLGDVVGQPWRQLAIAQPAVLFLGQAHPGAEMDLVDRQRCGQIVGAATSGHPFLVAPGIPRELEDLRCGARGTLGGKAVGVGLVDHRAVLAR